MNRQEFFRRLEYLLRGIPEIERMDALAYYNDYFDDAGADNEQQVIFELGSPEAVAQIILEDYYRGQQENYTDYSDSKMKGQAYKQGQNTQKKEDMTLLEKIKSMSKSTKILIIILLVLTFPIWIGVVAGIFGGVVGLLGGLFGVVVGLGGAAIGILVAGVACLVVGILRSFTSPVEGVVSIGIGALFTAIGILLIVLFALLVFKWFPILVRAITKWAKGLLNRQKGGDEI